MNGVLGVLCIESEGDGAYSYLDVCGRVLLVCELTRVILLMSNF